MAHVLWRAPSTDFGLRAAAEEVEPEPGVVVASGTAKTEGPDTSWVIGAYALVIVAAFAGWGLFALIEPAEITAPAGFSAFAPLYILAQSIERLLDPLTKYLGAAAEGGEKKTKEGATAAREEAFDALAKSPSPQTAEQAARAQALVERIRRNTVVIAWGAASTLAILACGAFGIRLLDAIGFDVHEALDITVTGLAVGSGTKPLHDLISNLQKAKDQRANPPGTTTV